MLAFLDFMTVMLWTLSHIVDMDFVFRSVRYLLTFHEIIITSIRSTGAMIEPVAIVSFHFISSMTLTPSSISDQGGHFHPEALSEIHGPAAHRICATAGPFALVEWKAVTIIIGG